MADNEERRLNGPQFGIGIITRTIQQARLAWALIRDDRVPLLLKAIPLVALIYVLSPIDLIPDFIPVLGQLDDLGIAMLAISVFNSLASADIVSEHQQRLSGGATTSSDGPFINVKAKRDDH